MGIESLGTEEKNKLIVIVEQALQRADGDELNLFKTPLNYIEEEGRIKFNYPSWMLEIKSLLLTFHSEKQTQALMLDIMIELMKPGGVKKLIAKEENIPAKTA